MELEEFSAIVEEASTKFLELSKSYCKTLDYAAGMCKSLKDVVPEAYAPARISPETYLLLYEAALSAAKAGTRLIELGALLEKKWDSTQKYARHYKARFSHLNKELEEGTSTINGKLEEIRRIKGAKAVDEEAELNKMLRKLQGSLENISRETANSIERL